MIQGNTITNLVGGGWVHAIGAGSLGLILNAVALPTATVTAGSITVK